jgi:zinc transporter ZupT
MGGLDATESLKVGSIFVIGIAALSGFWMPLFCVAMGKRRNKRNRVKKRTNLLEHPLFMATKSFSAGIILGVAVMHLLPDGMEDLEDQSSYPVALGMMCLGVILTLCLEQVLSLYNSGGHHHHGGPDHQHNHSLAARLSQDIHESSIHSAATDISQILRLREEADNVIIHEHAHNHGLSSDQCDEHCSMQQCQDHVIYEEDEEMDDDDDEEKAHQHGASVGVMVTSSLHSTNNSSHSQHSQHRNSSSKSNSRDHDHLHSHDHDHGHEHEHEHGHDHGHGHGHSDGCCDSHVDDGNLHDDHDHAHDLEGSMQSNASYNSSNGVGMTVATVTSPSNVHYSRLSRSLRGPSKALSADPFSKDYSIDANTLKDLQNKAFIKTLVLEISIAIHSIIVGFGFGLLVENLTVKVLIIALSFHQFFEGVSLGTTIAETALASNTKLIFSIIFSTTMPLGIAIGLLTTSASGAGSSVQGYANSLASGSLLYSSLVEMVAELFNADSLRHAPYTRVSMVLSFALGCGILATLAVWS